METVVGGGGDDTLTAGSAPATLKGLGGNDTLIGGAGNDMLLAGEGDDVLDGRGGADGLYGESDTDTIDYGSRSTGVSIDLAAGAGGEPGEGDRLDGIENAVGGSGPDVIVGAGAVFNTIQAGAGDDEIRVRDGDALTDQVDCGDGNDRTDADPFDGLNANCEPSPLPAPDPKTLLPRIGLAGSPNVRLGTEGVVPVTLRCLTPTVGACTGTLTLNQPVGKKLRRLGRAKFRINVGQSKTVRVRIAKKTAANLRRHHKRGLSVRGDIMVTDASARRTTAKLKLKLSYRPKATKKR